MVVAAAMDLERKIVSIRDQQDASLTTTMIVMTGKILRTLPLKLSKAGERIASITAVEEAAAVAVATLLSARCVAVATLLSAPCVVVVAEAVAAILESLRCAVEMTSTWHLREATTVAAETTTLAVKEAVDSRTATTMEGTSREAAPTIATEVAV